jgi:hypothetical protein
MVSDMDENISYSTMNRKLLGRFPVLAPAYDRLRSIYDEEEPGQHIVYGDVLTPHLISVLEGRQSDLSLPEVFELLEALANNSDLEVQNVVAVSVIERLNDKREWREKARSFMGPTTLRVSHEMERAWGS